LIKKNQLKLLIKVLSIMKHANVISNLYFKLDFMFIHLYITVDVNP